MSKKCPEIRTISKELLDELKSGKFKPFVDIVKKKQEEEIDDNLALCFRGSAGKEIVSIYKYNTKMWDLSFDKENKPIVTIQLNFGRFSEDWKEKVEELVELGFKNIYVDKYESKYKNKYINSDYRICDLVYTIDKKTEEKVIRNVVDKSYMIMSDMMDDYYMHSKETKFYDKKNSPHKYFKEYYCRHNEKDNESFNSKKQYRLEKHIQQEIFMKNHNFENGLFLYDLEFHQPKIDGMNGIKEYINNAPDMFGILYDKQGIPEAICLVEIKSTKDALKSTKKSESGLCDHRDGMEKYINCEMLMQDRIEEALAIMSHYATLGLYGVTADKVKVLEEKIKEKSLSKNIIFIFTNDLKMDTQYESNEEMTIEKAMKNYEKMDDSVVKYGRWCHYSEKHEEIEPFSYIKK